MTCTFFVFKQRTAYEVRISCWSSDVCSSDLDEGGCGQARPARDGLHRVVVEALRVGHDRERVAGAGAVGEDVELEVGAGHGDPWGEEGERAASVGGRCRAGIEERVLAGAASAVSFLPPFRCDAKSSWLKPLLQVPQGRSEEHTSELQSLMRISYAVFC